MIFGLNLTGSEKVKDIGVLFQLLNAVRTRTGC